MVTTLIAALALGLERPDSTGLPEEIRLIGLDEYFPRTSDVINLSGPGLDTDEEDRHVLALKFKNIEWPAGEGGPWYTIAMQYPAEVPYHLTGALVGDMSQGTNEEKYGVKINWDTNGEAVFCVPASLGEFPDEIHIFIKKTESVWNEMTQQWEPLDPVYYYPTLDLDKVVTTDAAIDARKGYGQPNEAGQIMADANSSLRNVWFGGYKWSGGLFAGNMPDMFADRSGLSRIQFWPETLPSNIMFATLSLLDVGAPTVKGIGGTAPAEIPILGVYIPLTNDANISVLESAVVWGTRWNITPGGAGQGGSGGATNVYGQDAAMESSYGAWDEESETGGSYINWSITWVDLDEEADPIYSTPAFQHGLCLALVDEADYEEDTGIYWRYFGSREYQGLFTHPDDFPKSDSRPRVWVVTVGVDHDWHPSV